jgi:hypothetical protein
MDKRSEFYLNKKGFSQIINVILLVLISLVLISIFFSFALDFIREKSEISSVQAELLQETAKIKKVEIDSDNPNLMRITFCCSEGKITGNDKKEEEIQEPVNLDIGLVIDRSGSMRQSGWVLEIKEGTSPLLEDMTLNVPKDDYTSSIDFNVPTGTESLAVLLDWGQAIGYSGSEGTEFALNLRNPSETWIYGNNKPTVGGKVDPPDNTGLDNYDFFSGISTKPQVVYIENPEEGNWRVRVYGWNLRPRTGPPPSQDVNVSVYLGSSSELIKGSTILSIEAAKDSARDFVNAKRDTDFISYTVFGSQGNALLLQTLTNSKALLLNAIDSTGQQGGTAIQDGIETSTQDLLSNRRAGSEMIMVILTDGQNDAGPQVVIDEATNAKNQGIKIYTLGLTGFVDEEMLKLVATDPSYYYYVSDSSLLQEIFNSVRNRIVLESTGISLSDGLKIVFYNDSYSYSPEEQVVDLLPLETKTYSFNLEGKITNVKRIEVYPIRTIYEKEIIGPLLHTYTFQ